MSGGTSIIHCPVCRAESVLKKTPRYDGFKKVGETLSCADCGHEFASETELPVAGKARPKIFSEDDAPPSVKIFKADEAGKFCRYCRHYVVNPFTQRCSLHQRVVQATDICPQFEPAVPLEK